MKKMSLEAAALLKDNGMKLFFWQVVSWNKRFLLLRNWLTGDRRVLHK